MDRVLAPTICVRCGRRGERGFVAVSQKDDKLTISEWACANYKACEKRQRARERKEWT